jgi:hypothetical protein
MASNTLILKKVWVNPALMVPRSAIEDYQELFPLAKLLDVVNRSRWVYVRFHDSVEPATVNDRRTRWSLSEQQTLVQPVERGSIRITRRCLPVSSISW